MKILENLEQGGEDWHECRLEVVTASRFKDVLAKGKGLTRASYMRELAAEAITGEKQESYNNSAMQHGTDTESQARSMYELMSYNDVEQIGFIKHDKINAGASPDGLIGNDGLVEIKCPKTTTQIDTYLRGKMPTGHIPQVQGQMWVSERLWCDFVSFDPRINGKSGYFCERIYRDDEYINALETAVIEFNKELSALIEKLT